MSNFIKKDGFPYAFDPNGCNSCNGNCCVGESGYIWISSSEIEALALHLNLTTEAFKSKYLFKEGYKYSIKEIQLDKNNFACCFFDLNKRQCSIYDFRPIQCRTFPFGTISK